MRIESIQFKNYKLLRDATLPLEPLTVIVGPNGGGKSTVLEALRHAAAGDGVALARSLSFGDPGDGSVQLRLNGRDATDAGSLRVHTSAARPGSGLPTAEVRLDNTSPTAHGVSLKLLTALRSFRSFALVPDRMREPVALTPGATLSADGATLSAALDQLRDRNPDAWMALNDELGQWLSEFDAVLFDTSAGGMRAAALRARRGRAKVPVAELSTGTVLALGLLTIVHGETAPAIIGIEEPETGIHPRLLRNVFDALVSMAYPAENGIGRPPRPVIVTTHSPYFLDLFKDMPECVVIADRRDDAVTFTRLADHPDVDEIVLSAPLGESWFTGVLGGVPIGPKPPTAYPVNAAA